MKKQLLGGLAAVLVVGFAASSAFAQCAFEHPKKAGKFQGNFVQAFVSCGNAGGNSPNTTTEGNVPTCKPPETYNEQAGSPPTGWTWDEEKGQGQVQLKASKTPPVNILNPVGDTTDLAVKCKAKGIVYSGGSACDGGANDAAVCTDASECPGGECAEVNIPAGPASGFLATVARATFDDRAGGDMTVVDFPANFPLPISDGKINVKTSADVLLNGISQPGLPHCSNIETVSVTITDENGNTFANVGLFLP
jgi:hypothetical protein